MMPIPSKTSRSHPAEWPVLISIVIVVAGAVSWKERSYSHAAALMTACAIAANSGQWQVGLAEIKRATLLDPGNAYYEAVLGLCLAHLSSPPFPLWLTPPVSRQERHQISLAIDAYQTALTKTIRADPRHLANLGWLYWRIGDSKKAVVVMSEAVALDKSNSLARVSYGLILALSGDTSRANDELSAALALEPALLESRVFGFLYPTLEERKQIINSAVNILEALQTTHASPVVGARLGRLYLVQSKTKQAWALLLRSTTQLPTLSRAKINLAVAEEELDNPAAEQLYSQANRTPDPTDRWAVYMLASRDLRTKQFGRVLDRCLNAISRPRFIDAGHARRLWRLYHISTPIYDDVLPPGLLSFTTSFSEDFAFYRLIALAYSGLGDQELFNRYKTLEELHSRNKSEVISQLPLNCTQGNLNSCLTTRAYDSSVGVR